MRTHRRGERIGRRDGLYRNVEVGSLPRERASGVSLRKGRPNGALVAHGDADKLVLEPRQERVRAERHLDISPFAAFEGHTLNRSVEVNRDAITDLSRRAHRLLGIAAALLHQAIERGLDV